MISNSGKKTIGGMRRPLRSVAMFPGLARARLRIRDILQEFLRQELEDWKPGDPSTTFVRCLEVLGSEDPDAGPTEHKLDQLRLLVRKELDAEGVLPVVAPASEDQTCLPTPVEWDILEGWRCLAGDPEMAAATWFRDGAPQGIGPG